MEREFIRNSDEIDWARITPYKYYIYYDHDYREITISDNTYVQGFDLYTTNKEWLEQFIEEHEEDIKRYYFEIEEETK